MIMQRFKIEPCGLPPTKGKMKRMPKSTVRSLVSQRQVSTLLVMRRGMTPMPPPSLDDESAMAKVVVVVDP